MAKKKKMTEDEFIYEETKKYYKKLLIDEGLDPKSKEYKDQLKENMETFDRYYAYESSFIQECYLLEIPRTKIYEFGYTDEEIDDEFEDIDFNSDEEVYPY